jgi:hypothetical protein
MQYIVGGDYARQGDTPAECVAVEEKGPAQICERLAARGRRTQRCA